MIFNYAAAAELYIPKKGGVARVNRSVIVASLRRLRQFVSRLKISPLFARLVHGCGWEMSASTAMTFGIFTRATTIHGAVACENLVEKQGAHPRRLKGVL
jgi:hypothetical protein